jgi:5-formyltetrahydrofolate cyclo-ligase
MVATSPLTKDALRKQLWTLRAELAARNPDAGEQLADRFPMKLLERFGPRVGSYLPAGSEIDPRPLAERLAGAGAELALPRMTDAGELVFHAYTSGDALEPTAFKGVFQPQAQAPLVAPNLILVPLVGFDRLGNRLGQGQGWFDRYLGARRHAARQGGPRVFACGLGFAGQQVDALPLEPHDEPLDWVATEQGQIPAFMLRATARPETEA